MNLNYIIYRIFETKWKKRVFDEAIRELDKIDRLGQYRDFDMNMLHKNGLHFIRANELMDLII